MKYRNVKIPDALFGVMVNCLPPDVPNTAKNVGYALETLIVFIGTKVMREDKERAGKIGCLLVEYYKEERKGND